MSVSVDRRDRRARPGSLIAWAGLLLLAASGCGDRTAREEVAAPSPAPVTAASRPFERLSQYGLFAGDPAAQVPAEGVIPYDLNSALFSDYAEKFRFVKLPAGTQATYRDADAFEFPVGTVIAKTFAYPRDARDPSKGRRLIETRILKREPDGWVGLPYIWNAAQTEATLDVAGDTVDVSWIHTDGRARTNNYIIPNVNQCKGCHKSGEVMTPIGPKARHLNRDFAYREGTENQLAHWTPPRGPGRCAAARSGAAAGRLGRPEERHARRPRPRLAGDQLRPLPQPRRPGAEQRPRPGGRSAQPGRVRREQAAGGRRHRLGRPHVRHRPRPAGGIHPGLPDRLDPPGRHDARAGQAAGARGRRGAGAAMDRGDDRSLNQGRPRIPLTSRPAAESFAAAPAPSGRPAIRPRIRARR